MPDRRTRSLPARSAFALGALAAALALSPVAVTAAQAAPAHHGTVTESVARGKVCYKTVFGGPDHPGSIGVRISHDCGAPGQA